MFSVRFVCVTVLLALLLVQTAAASRYSDLPAMHPASEAVAALTEQGILSGYADGTYQPARGVNRAEAVTMLVRALYPESALRRFADASIYDDVPGDSWYASHAALAERIGAIDGPPGTSQFHGERPVLLVEFLKMLFLLDKRDVTAYKQMEIPVSADVDDQYVWFYPYMLQAVTATMITPQDDFLFPGKELNRAETALFLHRYLLYREHQHINRARTLFRSHIADFSAEFAVSPESDRAEQLAFRALLLSQSLLHTDASSSEFLALQAVARSTMALFQEEHEEVRALLEQIQHLSSDIYQEYVSDLIQALERLPD